MIDNIEVENGPLRIENGRLVQIISDIEIWSPPIPDVELIHGHEYYLTDPKKCKWEKKLYGEEKSILPEFFDNIEFDDEGDPFEYDEDGEKVDISDEKVEYIAEEWRRRRDGYWFFVYYAKWGKAIPMYITGAQYMYLQWWTTDAANIEFRDTDRRWFWFIKFCEDDPYILGDIVLDRRQEGKGTKAGLWLYDRITKGKSRHGGIQSKNGTDAKSFFTKFVVTGWQKLPFFFSPKFQGSTDPVSKIVFKSPAVKGKKAMRGGQVVSTSDLGSIIEARPSGEKAFDGETLFAYVGDEEGKTDLAEADIVERARIVKKALLKDGIKNGVGHHTSTAELMERGGLGRYKKLWNDSKYSERDPVTKMTKSGLVRYFKPAYDCFWRDEWGFSLNDSKDAIIHLNATFDQETDSATKNSLKRMDPFTVADAFRTDGKGCAFDIIKLQNAILFAEAYHKTLWKPYSLSWDHEVSKTGIIHKIDTKIIATPDEGGRFFFRYLPVHEANNVIRDFDGDLAPGNNERFALAIDPYDAITVKNPEASDGACTGFRKFDMHLDDNKPIKDWETNRYFVYYCARPEGGPDEFFEDMVMLTHFLGVEALIEKNKWGLYNYFIKRGREKFISNRPESSMGASKAASNKEEKGVDSTVLVKTAYFGALDQYIKTYYELCDCLPILNDWLDMEFEHMTKYDLGVASGLTQLQINKYIRPEKRIESGDPFVVKYKRDGHKSIRIK